MTVPTATHQYFTTSTVTADNIGVADLTQNNGTYLVTADDTKVNAITVAKFPGTGTTPTVGGNYTAPYGDSAFLYSTPIIGTSNFTCGCWVYFDTGYNYASVDTSSIIYERGGGWGNTQLNTATFYDKFFTYRTGTSDSFIYTPDILNETWHYVTISYSGGTIKIYLDGNLSQTSTGHNMYGTANYTYIGQMRTMNQCFKGYMYNMRIWNNIVLTDSEVLEAYNEDYPTLYPIILKIKTEAGWTTGVIKKYNGTSWDEIILAK